MPVVEKCSTGALLFGGDWACAHGDVEGLGWVAKLLAARLTGPIQLELCVLERLCRDDSVLASRRWALLRHWLGEAVATERASGARRPAPTQVVPEA
jgi:hypothetical protein